MAERDALFGEGSRYGEEIGWSNAQIREKTTHHWIRRGDLDQALRWVVDAGADPGNLGLGSRFEEVWMRVARGGPSAARPPLEDTSRLTTSGKQIVQLGRATILVLRGEFREVLALPDLEIADALVLLVAVVAAHVTDDAAAIASYSVKLGAR